MNKTRKRLIWEQDKHDALKILIRLSDPEIWIDHAIYEIEHELIVSHRTAKKLFKYWQKRWNFKVNTVWDSSIRGLWALRPMITTPLLKLSDMKSEIILVDGENSRFTFTMPLTKL